MDVLFGPAVLTAVLSAASALFYGNPSAAVSGDQLFAMSRGRLLDADCLYRGTLRVYERRAREPLPYWNPVVETINRTPAKVDLRDNRLLFVESGGNPRLVPLTELGILEFSAFGNRLAKLRGYGSATNYLNAEAFCSGRWLLYPPFREPDVPAPVIPISPDLARSPGMVRWWREFDYICTARFDVQLVGPKTVRLFHAFKDTLFVSVEPDYLNHWRVDAKKWDIAGNMHAPPERELRTGKVPAEFTEYFVTYRAGERDFLVTESGKVFMVVPKGKAELEVTKIWDDPKRRLVGVVKDADADAVYGWGFAGTRESADRFRVKFEPKPVAVAYKRTVPLWDDRSNAYLESYECARAFRLAAEKKE